CVRERSLKRGMRKALGRAILVSAVLAAGAVPAWAHGALAIGETEDVGRDGYAYGNAVNSATPEDAARRALANCEKYQGAPKAVARCQVVSTFQRQCYAIALDPQ